MEKIIVHGGQKLVGSIEIEGAKNAVLPILAASLLAKKGVLNLESVPVLSDVYMMNNVLKFLNVKVEMDEKNKTVSLDATSDLSYEAPFKYVSKMRASIVVFGPLLARLGHAKVAMPGGCAIGSRPIDLHLKGLEAMGAHVEQHDGYIEATTDGLVGADIYLDFPSVGATENIMMAATLAKGITILENVAREPEIVDLANVLNKMGANISGAGTERLKIVGVKELHGTEHTIVQDRIEAGTFMVAAAATNGNILIKHAIAEHNRPLISKLEEMGVSVSEEEEGIRVIGTENLKPVSVKTLPHPGFPTDMQPQISILQLLANGESSVTETVFENRFMHFEELKRMNANVRIEGNSALIHGPAKMHGAEVAATDLRAAAALILAGLAATGYTQVTHLKYLDRGYYHFHQKLASLGAEIKRVDESDVVVVNKEQLSEYHI
ncbi:UDP-N-acetylglucosamine 1-carboxyvinyltransferase [Liquorilactobacillus cacaonum]|uniref:UDP-N-acetylglucosamine 1-carboxyvinyltransferase n=1 Tax=Liquorilactobacillus cacaonum DSM 21116 TaxID=1423729 RepID=A0A0R2CH57_9LACO|nr:UDP-N-acetylglucosamine 1-carboxyvinyltransferase [Liquorilactobacillus cacaonum]KRM90823.1 UDP-N-acetylglucosamine 1-carboxyvinyltransferase [Liquorilactobacillus cacaonum DSM 21116]